MNKIYRPFLILTLLVYTLVLISLNSFTAQQDFQTHQKLYHFDEYQFKGHLADFNFLLQYPKITAVALYNDGNRAIYDPEGNVDLFHITYDKFSYLDRYFNREDYQNKSNVFIEFSESITDDTPIIEDGQLLQTIYTNATPYLLFNLLAYNKPFEKLIIFGEDYDGVKKELLNKGLTLIDQRYYSPLLLLNINTSPTVYAKFNKIYIYIGILFSIFVYVIEFKYLKKTIKIHIINGMSTSLFLKKYLMKFIVYLSIGIALINSFLLTFEKYIFMPIASFLLLSIITILFYSLLFLILSLYTIYRMEHRYEVH